MNAPYLNLRRYVETFSTTTFGMLGIFTCRAISADGRVTREVSFPNLITNLGLDAFGSGPQFTHMVLGTGTTPPAFTDTGLSVFGVSVNPGGSSTSDSGASNIAPYYGWTSRTWTSSIGGATGNWTEIGVSNQNTNGNLRSHALILDNLGNPTTFTVLPTEQFQGTYELRVYPPSVDSPAAITLSGTPYNTVTRALAVTAPNQPNGGWQPDLSSVTFRPEAYYGLDSALYTGGLAAVTASQPAGSHFGSISSVSSASYINGNHFLDNSYVWGSGGSAGTVQTIRLRLRSGTLQCAYTPSFSKTSTQQLIHNQRVNWARR